MIEMFIPVKPIAKGRPRFGKGHVYTPESTKKAEQVYMINAKKEFNAKYGIYLKVGEL